EATYGGAVYVKRGELAGGLYDLQQQLANGTSWYDTRIAGTRRDAFFGTSVATGDFNGDGMDDLIVGSPGARTPDLNQGAVYVFFGPLPNGNLQAEDANVILRGEAVAHRFGESVTVYDLDD